MDEALDTLGRTIGDALAASVKGYAVAHHELTVEAQAADIVAVMRFLRDDPRCLFWNIVDVTAIDWPGREHRFDVVYHLLSPKHNARIRVKIAVDEGAAVNSIIGVYPGADWFERELFDLYGVVITGHPDMRRLLTDYGFDGHPLRKDFPLTGFVEVRYDDASSESSTSRCSSRRSFATSISCRPGKAPNTRCQATRRRPSRRPASRHRP